MHFVNTTGLRATLRQRLEEAPPVRVILEKWFLQSLRFMMW